MEVYGTGRYASLLSVILCKYAALPRVPSNLARSLMGSTVINNTIIELIFCVSWAVGFAGHDDLGDVPHTLRPGGVFMGTNATDVSLLEF